MKQPISRTGLGKKAHRFLSPDSTKPCVIAGNLFEDVPGFLSHSDGDVVFHALCNAITSLTGVQVLGEMATSLFAKDGITDSEVYLKHALKALKGQKIQHVSISLEAKRPRFQEMLEPMRMKIAEALGIKAEQVCITATSGAGLSDCGCGDGVECLALLTTTEEVA